MWRLKQFLNHDHGGTLEGKCVDVGHLKVQVRNTIAKGGFSCVYLVKDVVSGKSYALKQIVCTDMEMLDLVKKEVQVMELLKGHPNVVTLHAQALYDLGRTKECFLVMDYCERTLVDVLDNRGAGYFEEKQLLAMFREVCNSVYAMHSQVPAIAHRDLKAENLLQGVDGVWKLCDFGSTTSNHKRFEKPDEMGVEEDVIRKHTTPAYRAPEMWDLFRREVISEKVDIWALGCLLFRMAYFTSAFTGDSKLQILNGNYKIPELPRYSDAVTGLIRDLLKPNPDARPDVEQVWRRVNQSLPVELQKRHPDKPPVANNTSRPTRDAEAHHAAAFCSTSTSSGSAPMPSRKPPSPPKDLKASVGSAGAHDTAAGSFWSSQYAQSAPKGATEGRGSPLKVPVSPQPGARVPVSPQPDSRVPISPQPGARVPISPQSSVASGEGSARPASSEGLTASRDASLAANMGGRLSMGGASPNGGSPLADMKPPLTNRAANQLDDSKAGGHGGYKDSRPTSFVIPQASSRRTVFGHPATAEQPGSWQSDHKHGAKSQGGSDTKEENAKPSASIWELQEGLSSPVFRDRKPRQQVKSAEVPGEPLFKQTSSNVQSWSSYSSGSSYASGLDGSLSRSKNEPLFQTSGGSFGMDNGSLKHDVFSSSARFSPRSSVLEEPMLQTNSSSSGTVDDGVLKQHDMLSSSSRFAHRPSYPLQKQQDDAVGWNSHTLAGPTAWSSHPYDADTSAAFSSNIAAGTGSSSAFPALDARNKRAENHQARPKTQPAGWAGF